MNSIATISPSAIARESNPQQFRASQAKLDAITDYAARMQDWPILEEAIDAKIEDQAEFVGWWDEKVRAAGNRPIVADRATIDVAAASTQTGVTKEQVSRWRKHLKDRAKYREKMILAAYRKADLTPSENHRAEGTGENDWFTPVKYIEAARAVMGDIDLDPATHPAAQQVVQATEYYTKGDDGLSKQWMGRVWLNPPYAQPLIGQFVEKLVTEFAAGNVSEAILLTHNYTDTAWFHQAEGSAKLICFTKGRIRFVDADGEECSPTQGQAMFYLGQNGDQFRAVFRAFGFIR